MDRTTLPAMVTAFGRPLLTTEATHYEHRIVDGSDPWPLPLCWHASIVERLGEDDARDDDAWNLAADHGAIEPDELQTTTDPASVTCPDCTAWMHA